ncbi:hypothetical protein CsSME_00051609 [Camellia sinensis var. sinensis]
MLNDFPISSNFAESENWASFFSNSSVALSCPCSCSVLSLMHSSSVPEKFNIRRYIFQGCIKKIIYFEYYQIFYSSDKNNINFHLKKIDSDAIVIVVLQGISITYFHKAITSNLKLIA